MSPESNQVAYLWSDYNHRAIPCMEKKKNKKKPMSEEFTSLAIIGERFLWCVLLICVIDDRALLSVVYDRASVD